MEFTNVLYEVYKEIYKHKSKSNIYFSTGGIGDFIIILSEAYDDPDAFLINCISEEKEPLCRDFCDYFKIKNHFIKNLSIDEVYQNVYLKIKNKIHKFGHLPDNLDYWDWLPNQSKYESRIKKTTDWFKIIGKHKDQPLSLVMAPKGGDNLNNKLRYLEIEDYVKIVESYVEKNWVVFLVGTEEDRKFYPRINSEKCFWITNNKIIHEDDSYERHNFIDFLRYINSASRIASVDTWLKTYASLCGLDVLVFRSRDQETKKILEWGKDPSDRIFLNPNIWPKLNLCNPKDLITSLY
jgi:hypothetical protein